MNFKKTSENPVEYHYRPRSVALGDFNNDTLLDLVIANTVADNIAIFSGYGNGTFSYLTKYTTGFNSNPYMVTVGDFNNDHRLDLAVANFGSNSIGIFLGCANGSFVNQTVLSTNASHPIWINVADLNNDTALDIIITNYEIHSIAIFYGYGNGTFDHSVFYSTGYDSLPFAVITGDFNTNKLWIGSN